MQPQLIRYGTSIDASPSNQLLMLSVNSPLNGLSGAMLTDNFAVGFQLNLEFVPLFKTRNKTLC